MEFPNVYPSIYPPPNEHVEYGYPHSNAVFTFFRQRDSENVLC